MESRQQLATATETRRALLGILEDHQRVEAALRQNEEKFRHVFESANVGKSITLPTGEINANKAFCGMLGYAKEELQNKKWQEITPSEEIESTQQKLGPLLTGSANAARFEKRYIHKNGSHIWADVSDVMQFDAARNPLYFITTIIDITERKQVEAERERLLAAIEQTGETVMVTDPEGTIQYVNPAFEMVTGYSREEAVGKNPRFLKSGEQDQGFYQKLWQSISSGIDRRLTHDVRGTRYRIAGPAEDGRPVHVVCRFSQVAGLMIITVHAARGVR